MSKIKSFRKLLDVMIDNPDVKYIATEWLETDVEYNKDTDTTTYLGNWYFYYSAIHEKILCETGLVDINDYLMSDAEYELYKKESNESK